MTSNSPNYGNYPSSTKQPKSDFIGNQPTFSNNTVTFEKGNYGGNREPIKN